MKNNLRAINGFYLGEFVADIVLKGIIHEDMHLGNIGHRDIKLVLRDYGKISKISLPEDLTCETFYKLTRALCHTLFSLPNDFSVRSYFRTGFTAYGGVLTHAIFSNTINKGLSSFIYAKKSPVTAAYNPDSLFSDKNFADAIIEWKNSPLDRITLTPDFTPKTYLESNERHLISPYNKYYLDNLYFVRTYLTVGVDGLKDCSSIFNLALSAQQYGLYYTAYGLYQKCISLTSNGSGVNTACQERMEELNSISKIDSRIVKYINKCITYDLFELMWILHDLESAISNNTNIKTNAL